MNARAPLGGLTSTSDPGAASGGTVTFTVSGSVLDADDTPVLLTVPPSPSHDDEDDEEDEDEAPFLPAMLDVFSVTWKLIVCPETAPTGKGSAYTPPPGPFM